MREKHGHFDLPGMVGDGDQWSMHGAFVKVWRVDAACDAGVNADEEVDEPVHDIFLFSTQDIKK